jgi:hypothetical protein
MDDSEGLIQTYFSPTTTPKYSICSAFSYPNVITVPANFILESLPQFPNLRHLTTAFLTPVITHSKRFRLYQNDFEKTHLYIFRYVPTWLFGFTLFSKELARLRNLTSFECKAPLIYAGDIMPDSEDVKDECDCGKCAVPGNCPNTWHYSWIFQAFDAKFTVEPVTYIPEAELSRSNRAREARRTWQCNTPGNLLHTRSGCIEFLEDQALKKEEDRRARVLSRRDFLLDDKPFVWT